ncbi:hypothetical protein L249_3674 [Ophiocordyceps polyrhachis-furcata BCC 54312]|uniref:Carboxylic ester hydrolase n=1 Tax=Ophiocordyceps polyrhachis-furcata BCC 54312 TaxID=1330021 RepID=A0A367L4Q8_9HYPO|nr:hypothetical protein L249_3674 [Ophiocordyceps polyrhachis-furcata BCC 54312]
MTPPTTALSIVLSLQLLAGAQGSLPTVTIDTGDLVGTTSAFSSSSAVVNRFLGIPFADAPVRFNRAEPVSSKWQDVYNATQYKPACIQNFKGPEEHRRRTMKWFDSPPPPNGESEDCLYLNVYAPADAAPGSKAVMFWIYGGNFQFGAGSLPLYDGSSFVANQDVVVVTSNYRTNVFGFPGSSEKPQSEQNLGLLDQRLALDWVQRNIHAFGGDPKRVTLFGESAGAGSVDTLILNPPPQPVPFAGAILQSGQSAISLPNHDSAASWTKLTKATNCDGLACVRALPAEQIRHVMQREKLTFFPVYDDGTTYASTGRIDRRNASSSRIARVPLLIGSNADEATVFFYGLNNAMSGLRLQVPAEEGLSKLLGAYSPKQALNRRLVSLAGDFTFTCPAKVIGEESASVGIPSWRYVFDAAFPNHEAFPGSGAWHSSEIDLVFGTYSRAGATAYQEKLSRAMQKAWADFAKDPSRGPGWASLPDNVAVFGGGVRPGKDCEPSTPAVDVSNGAKYDGKCWLFKPIYDAATLRRR